MIHIVVVGAGIGGVPAAYAAKAALGKGTRVTVVSDRDYFEFVPSNPLVAVGWRHFEDIAFPIAPYLAEREIDFIPKALRCVYPDHSRILLEGGEELPYDILILATGPTPALESAPGLDQPYCQSVLRAESAHKAFSSYQTFCSHPGPIVLGAMPRAAVLGPLYELAFLLDADLRRRNIREQVPITLVTPEPYVGHLGLGADQNTPRLVKDALDAASIRYFCNANTKRISDGTVELTLVDGQGHDIENIQLPFGYCVYWPHFRGIDALRTAPDGLADEEGRVLVDEYLRNPTFRNVFAVGLCIIRGTLQPTPLAVEEPESVYSIQNEVETVIRNVRATLEQAPLRSIKPARAQWLTDLGETGATRIAQPHVPLRNINYLKQGRWAYSVKLEFERHFINRIKLKPSAIRRAEGEVAAVADTLRSRTQRPPPQADVTGGSVQAHLTQPAFEELHALARATGRTPEDLAGELLRAALHDAKDYLSDAFLQELEQARWEWETEQTPERPAGEFKEDPAP